MNARVVLWSVFIYRAINLASGRVIRRRLLLCRAVQIGLLDVAGSRCPWSGHVRSDESRKLLGCDLNSKADIYQRNPWADRCLEDKGTENVSNADRIFLFYPRLLGYLPGPTPLCQKHA